MDFIVVYNFCRYRPAAAPWPGCMPYGDANAVVMEMGAEVITVATSIPVIAEVCGTDPFRLMSRFLREVKEAGFVGVQNYPTVCLFDGIIRANLEETGLGFDEEVDMIRRAHVMDLLTCSYVANPDEASAMAAAGADIIVPHMGLTTSGMVGAQSALTMDECKAKVADLTKIARKENPVVLVVSRRPNP